MTLCDVYCDIPGISLQSHYVGVLDMYGLRSTETQPTYDLEASVEPGSKRWEARLITAKPP